MTSASVRPGVPQGARLRVGAAARRVVCPEGWSGRGQMKACLRVGGRRAGPPGCRGLQAQAGPAVSSLLDSRIRPMVRAVCRT